MSDLIGKDSTKFQIVLDVQKQGLASMANYTHFEPTFCFCK